MRCREVNLQTADVLGWAPPEDLMIVWLYDPVRGEVFSSLTEHLATLVERRGEPLRIVYVNPIDHERVMATGRAVRLSPVRLRFAGFATGWVRNYQLRASRRSR